MSVIIGSWLCQSCMVEGSDSYDSKIVGGQGICR